jgi:hypothetical protein
MYDLLKPQELIEFNAKAEYHKSKGNKVKLTKFSEGRSTNLNSYLHVCISLYAIEYGCSLNEMKQTLKHWKKWFKTNKGGAIVYAKTSKMDNKQVSEFVEWIRNHAAINTGLVIPDADEYKANKFNIDREIDKHKAFL